ncbi:methyltransferase domain-containing protein [Sphingomonas canadensis]|nr:methyltransferase domain-containing protein [Sphingomonas canadensis]MCW3836538.1 methyltransferase domain-containing protein [Sphingomonas canadensis]
MIAAAALGAFVAIAAAPAPADPDLEAALKAPTRSAANMARDRYRHPAETLAFFGVKPGHTIVEIWPGGGWYTEILAPYTRGKGTLYGTGIWPDQLKGLQAKQAADPAAYGHVKLAAFPVFADSDPRVPAGSADVVLTFRNVHNWRMGYQRDGKDYSAEAFRQMFAMLKPGGILGVVDHRLPEDASEERELKSGYIKVSTVKRLAAEAGFVFVAASEVNANPLDTADWKDGVWTLPPVLRLKEVDRDKYLAIGESDRMTLKFRKP